MKCFIRFAKRLGFCLVLMAVLGSSSFAGLSPGESHPAFQMLLTFLLETDGMTDQQKVDSFDRFLEVLQSSFKPGVEAPFVADFQTYLRLRNQPHPTRQSALAHYLKNGLITPLNVRTPHLQVMEEITNYEVEEMRKFLRFTQQSMKASSDVLNPQIAIWNLLPDLYLTGRDARDTVDKTSEQIIQSSFRKADELRQKGNPAGLIAFAVGTGFSFARSIGENLINPIGQQVLHGESAHNQIRLKISGEIAKVKAWSREDKLALLAKFNSTVDSAIVAQIEGLREISNIRNLSRQIPLIDLIGRKLLPAYMMNLSRSQKSSLVWTVFNHPGFNRLDPYRQMQVSLNALGPGLPYLLRQLSKLPPLKDHKVASYFCCEVARSASLAPAAAFQSELHESLQLIGYELIKIDPEPIAVTALKETFVVTARKGSETRRLVVQILKTGVRENLEADIGSLRKLQSNVSLLNELQAAGAPDLKELISTAVLLITDEIDFQKTFAKQLEAQKAYNSWIKQDIGGRSMQIEIAVAPPLTNPQANTPFFIQEFASGLALEEARERSPELVQAALDLFAEKYMKEALFGSGFIWAEPSGRNMRFEFSQDGRSLRMNLLNFGSSERMPADHVKSFYASLARIPFSALKSQPRDLKTAIDLMQVSLNAGFRLDATTFRFAEGFMHLRELIGPENFQKILLKMVIKNPSILWSILGAKMKAKLSEIYRPLVTLFTQSVGTSAIRASAPICSRIHH